MRFSAKWSRASTFAITLAMTAGPACRETANHRTQVKFFETEDQSFSWGERFTIEALVTTTVDEVRAQLPHVPDELVVRVQASEADAVLENGQDAEVDPPDGVIWMVNPHHALGASRIAKEQLRATLFHQLNHLVRMAEIPTASMLDRAVSEGLAITFERDYAAVSKPWGWYPSNVAAWVDELGRVPDSALSKDWMYRHPDGREWVAQKAGTYLIDRAIRNSGRSSIELVAVPTKQILALANGWPSSPSENAVR
jgi:uncharacterized protein YjaZ